MKGETSFPVRPRCHRNYIPFSDWKFGNLSRELCDWVLHITNQRYHISGMLKLFSYILFYFFLKNKKLVYWGAFTGVSEKDDVGNIPWLGRNKGWITLIIPSASTASVRSILRPCDQGADEVLSILDDTGRVVLCVGLIEFFWRSS